MFFSLPTSQIEDRNSCLKTLILQVELWHCSVLVKVYSGVGGHVLCFGLVWVFFPPKIRVSL